MDITSDEYLFYEWLILGKNMTKDEFESLEPEKFKELKLEYIDFCSKEK